MITDGFSYDNDTLKWIDYFSYDLENFHIEVEQVRGIFKCDNYPVDIIDKCIKRFLEKLYVPKQIVPTPAAPKKELSIVFPFLGKIFIYEFESTFVQFYLEDITTTQYKCYFSI